MVTSPRCLLRPSGLLATGADEVGDLRLSCGRQVKASAAEPADGSSRLRRGGRPPRSHTLGSRPPLPSRACPARTGGSRCTRTISTGPRSPNTTPPLLPRALSAETLTGTLPGCPDVSGSVVASASYDAFGKLTGTTGSLPNWHWQGSWQDPVTSRRVGAQVGPPAGQGRPLVRLRRPPCRRIPSCCPRRQPPRRRRRSG